MYWLYLLCLCLEYRAASWNHLLKAIFFFKRRLIAMDPFWLYSITLMPWISLFICLPVSVMRMLWVLLNDAVWVCLCVLMYELSPPIILPLFPVSMMHQQSATPHYSSAQAGGQHYQGQQAMGMMGQGNQGNSMISQRPMGSYRSSQQGRW